MGGGKVGGRGGCPPAPPNPEPFLSPQSSELWAEGPSVPAQVGMAAATCVSRLCHVCPGSLHMSHAQALHTHVSQGVQAQAHACSLCVLALHMCPSPLHIYMPCMSSPCTYPTHTLALHMCVPTHTALHTCSDPTCTRVPCMSQPSTHPYPVCILVACTCVSDLYTCPMCVQFSPHMSLPSAHACPHMFQLSA